MNTNLSPKEAKEILTILKRGFNLNLGGTGVPAPSYGAGYNPKQPQVKAAPSPAPKMAPDYLGGGGAGGKALMSGLKDVGSDIASGLNTAASSVGKAVSGATNAVGGALSGAARGIGDAFNKVTTPNPNTGSMAQMTAGMAGVKVPNMMDMGKLAPKAAPVQTAAAPAPVQAAPMQQNVAQAPENPAMQMKAPTLQDRGIAVASPQPAQQAQQQFAGDVTDQERQLLRKLHASNFNPNSKMDMQRLSELRAAGKEMGGYDDFKNLRNLAYANQYGADSDYGRLAAKFRDSRAEQLAAAQGLPIKSSAEYTTLTRRNTGVTTTEGNVWINPADRDWLNKTAAYQDISWEDYRNLDPDDEPKSILSFFSNK